MFFLPFLVIDPYWNVSFQNKDYVLSFSGFYERFQVSTGRLLASKKLAHVSMNYRTAEFSYSNRFFVF